MSEVSVPTLDIDVKKCLRKLNQPICLFGEGPQERKNRLQLIIAKGIAVDFTKEEELPDLIPKYVTGDDSVGEAKKFFIDYSLRRMQERIRNEKGIDQQRIDLNNERGKDFSVFKTYASDFVESRKLTSLAVKDDIFAIGSLSSSIYLYSAKSMDKIKIYNEHNDRITSLSFVNQDLLCSTSFDKTIRFWGLESNVSSTINLEQFAQSSTSHPSERYVIVGLTDGCFGLIDIETQQIISQMKSNDGTISSVSLHPDGSIVMVGGSDTIGRLWDLRCMKSIKVLQGHNGRITSSKFDKDYHVISGSADNSIISWDLRNLSRSKKLSAHTSTITSVDIYDDLILTSSLDKTMKIWSLLDFRLYSTISDCPSPIVSSSFLSLDSSPIPYLLTASLDGSWRLYHTDRFL